MGAADTACTVHVVPCDGDPDPLGVDCPVAATGAACSLHIGFQHGRVAWTSHHLAGIHDSHRLNVDIGVAFAMNGEPIYHEPACDECVTLLEEHGL